MLRLRLKNDGALVSGGCARNRWIRSNRGPMGAGEFGDDGAAYWKLDLTEDHARRRRRLRRNLAFDSHEEASVEGRADAEHASLYALTTCIAADASRSPHRADADASGHSPSLSAACEGSTSSRKRNSLASRLLGQRPVVNAAAERAHFQVAAADWPRLRPIPNRSSLLCGHRLSTSSASYLGCSY